MRHPILRTPDTPHSHRVVVVVVVVERNVLFAVHIALSSPGCVPPYEPRGTNAPVLVVSSSTPHHPFVPSSLFPSVPELSPDCFSAIFVSALSASLG